MPVAMQVRQVRDELFRAAGPNGSSEQAQAAAKSAKLLGRIFHELFQEFVSDESPLFWGRVLADTELNQDAWHKRLLDEAWRHSIGPKLARHRAALQDHSQPVLDLWKAVDGLCEWLASNLFTARSRGAVTVARNGAMASPGLVAAEQQLLWIIKDTGWSDSVRLSGVCDALWRTPGGDWCVVELKLGKGSPSADLGQVALYHQMLSVGLGPGVEPICKAMAVVRFSPEKYERMYQGHEMVGALAKLKELIGRMAGVLKSPHPVLNDAGEVVASGSGIHARQVSSRKVSAEELELGKRLVAVCKEYGAPVELNGEPVVGAAFLRYFITPAKRVRRSAIERLAPEIQMRLNLACTPFVGQHQGQMAVELERPLRDTVTFNEIRSQLPAVNPLLGSAKMPLGVDLSGRLHTVNLAEPSSAHVLVAGTNGSGKSEWLRTAIAGLLLTNTPETLRLVLIDPKRSAFSDLRESPFLRNVQSLIYPDERSVIETLNQLIDEMELRYRVFGRESVDTLSELARRTNKPQQRIVCVCDEYCDLLTRDRHDRKEFEECVCRLGAKARAAGIHLVLATQQPSRETIKGALDANMSARVGFLMKNKIESRMLLNQAGCENLLGLGDMLYRDTGEALRLQAALLSREERQVIFQTPAAPEPEAALAR
jgi:S-DNA-T family DNA segregation ATPase FtsK/SpoIIIE